MAEQLISSFDITKFDYTLYVFFPIMLYSKMMYDFDVMYWMIKCNTDVHVWFDFMYWINTIKNITKQNIVYWKKSMNLFQYEIFPIL